MNLKLSPKYGVNPSLGVCFFCHKDKEVVMLGRLKDDAEAPRKAVYNFEPCDACKDYMARGIICIGVNPKLTTDPQNPWRTGRWAVITEAGFNRLGMDPELLAKVLEKRVCFMEDDVWDKLGIPVGEITDTKADQQEGEHQDG